MPNGIKVSHFRLTPPLRLLELFCENQLKEPFSKKIERWITKKLCLDRCSLRCGRTNIKEICFKVYSAKEITPKIWHVTGKLNGNRNVTLEADLNLNESHVIEKH